MVHPGFYLLFKLTTGNHKPAMSIRSHFLRTISGGPIPDSFEDGFKEESLLRLLLRLNSRVQCALMSFQAYIDNIQAKTGKLPQDFRDELDAEGLLRRDMKAGELVAWLKEKYGLGHGHSMAIWAVFKSSDWVDSK
jgi:hypothetical protein